MYYFMFIAKYPNGVFCNELLINIIHKIRYIATYPNEV